MLLPVICAFLTDAGAYFAGVFLGRHRGITKVSPNKSVEGYIGGILAGGLFLLLYGLILIRFAGLAVSLPTLAVYGLVGSAVTELGDLAFSFVKRQYGVKDYGHLLPATGGCWTGSTPWCSPPPCCCCWWSWPRHSDRPSPAAGGKQMKIDKMKRDQAGGAV